MARPKKNRSVAPAENIITFLRMHYGLTQQQLADSSGLTVMDVGKLERKENGIQLGKLQTLASHLHVPLDAIIHDRLELVIASLHTSPVIDHAAKLKLRNTQLKRLDVGLRGEELVLAEERRKLAGTPYENAVDPHYALDSSFGFDLLSFTPDGRRRYIEVKTTSDKKNTPFFMSANEKLSWSFALRPGASMSSTACLTLIGSLGGSFIPRSICSTSALRLMIILLQRRLTENERYSIS